MEFAFEFIKNYPIQSLIGGFILYGLFKVVTVWVNGQIYSQKVTGLGDDLTKYQVSKKLNDDMSKYDVNYQGTESHPDGGYDVHTKTDKGTEITWSVFGYEKKPRPSLKDVPKKK